MEKNVTKRTDWNAGKGMAFGVLVGAFIALIVSFTTGDSSVWAWAIPVGLATGLAIGAGLAQEKKHDQVE